MGELDVGNHILVFTPEGQVEDEIVRVLEKPSTMNVALIETRQCGRVALFRGCGYQLPDARWWKARQTTESG